MGLLLRLSAAIDALSLALGGLIRWLVLAAVLISAGNALVRKTLGLGSNAWLEIQWYLYAGVFMLGVGYVLLKNAHVRIDFISSRLSPRANAIIDAIGIVVFTIPLSLMLITLGWPIFQQAWSSGEMSQNAGGLVRWPVLLLVPVGFAILMLQALSELIKRIAFLTGHRDSPFTPDTDALDEAEVARELLEREQAAAAAAGANPGAAR